MLSASEISQYAAFPVCLYMDGNWYPVVDFGESGPTHVTVDDSGDIPADYGMTLGSIVRHGGIPNYCDVSDGVIRIEDMDYTGGMVELYGDYVSRY